MMGLIDWLQSSILGLFGFNPSGYATVLSVVIILIALGALLFYFGLWEYVAQALETMRSFFSTMVQSAPPKVKIIIFLIIFLTIGSILASVVVGVMFVCVGNELRTPKGSIFGGTMLYVYDLGSIFCETNETCAQLQAESNLSRNGFIANFSNTYTNERITDSTKGFFTIQCIEDNSPQLRILGINPFDYKMVILLIILGSLITLMLKI